MRVNPMMDGPAPCAQSTPRFHALFMAGGSAPVREVSFLRRAPAVPPQQRIGAHDRVEFHQSFAPDGSCLPAEKSSLCIGALILGSTDSMVQLRYCLARTIVSSTATSPITLTRMLAPTLTVQ